MRKGGMDEIRKGVRAGRGREEGEERYRGKRRRAVYWKMSGLIG